MGRLSQKAEIERFSRIFHRYYFLLSFMKRCNFCETSKKQGEDSIKKLSQKSEIQKYLENTVQMLLSRLCWKCYRFCGYAKTRGGWCGGGVMTLEGPPPLLLKKNYKVSVSPPYHPRALARRDKNGGSINALTRLQGAFRYRRFLFETASNNPSKSELPVRREIPPTVVVRRRIPVVPGAVRVVIPVAPGLVIIRIAVIPVTRIIRRRRLDVGIGSNLRPERNAAVRTDAEDFPHVRLDFEIRPESSRRRRRRQVDADINRLARRNRMRQREPIRRAHLGPARKNDFVIRGPMGRAVIPQPPGFRKRSSRRDIRSVRNRYVGNKRRAVRPIIRRVRETAGLIVLAVRQTVTGRLLRLFVHRRRINKRVAGIARKVIPWIIPIILSGNRPGRQH